MSTETKQADTVQQVEADDESPLCDLKCKACRGGIPPMGAADIAQYMKRLQPDSDDSGKDAWTVIDGSRLEKTFTFRNFKLALAFVNKVGEVSEQEGHHPDIKFGWGYATTTIYTHKINGLAEADFILAAKIDKL